MYYLRTRPKADAIQFTVDQTALAETKKANTKAAVNDENVVNVGSSGNATKGLDYEAEVACESCSA